MTRFTVAGPTSD